MSRHIHNHDTNSSIITSAQATLHCLVGCVIGEMVGLIIGVSLGIGIWKTILLATFLAYVSGFTLGLIPVMRRENKLFLEAFRIIWIGEVISIGVMEVVMNTVDYAVGGMQSGTVFTPIFWYGLALAILAGFLAAWPINWWLLSRNIKKCH